MSSYYALWFPDRAMIGQVRLLAQRRGLTPWRYVFEAVMEYERKGGAKETGVCCRQSAPAPIL